MSMAITAFFILLLSHAGILYLGWWMGTQTNPDVLMSKPTKKNDSYVPEPDIFEEEMLDFD